MYSLPLRGARRALRVTLLQHKSCVQEQHFHLKGNKGEISLNPTLAAEHESTKHTGRHPLGKIREENGNYQNY